MFVSLECFSPGLAGGWEPGSVYGKFVSPSQLFEQMLYGVVVGGRGKTPPPHITIYTVLHHTRLKRFYYPKQLE